MSVPTPIPAARHSRSSASPKHPTLYRIAAKVRVLGRFGRFKLVVAGFALVILFIAVYAAQETFIIEAETEVLQVVTEDASASTWPMTAVEVWSKDAKVADGPATVTFAPNTTLLIQHDVHGVLRVRATPCDGATCPHAPSSGDPVAWVETEASGEQALSGPVVLKLPTSKDDDPLVIPLKGKVTLGQPIMEQVDNLSRAALVRGRIRVLAQSVLKKEAFVAGNTDLLSGDVVSLMGDEHGDTTARGFLRLAWRVDGPSMTVNIHSSAHEVRVARFGSEGYVVSASLWHKLERDPFLLALEALFTFLLFFGKELFEILGLEKHG